jgi:hypothetical protein
VVQYRVIVAYTSTVPSQVEYATFTNPEWYYPVDLNATFADAGFSPYYFVFSCPTGTVFFNEFFYAVNSGYFNREFIEIIGPRNAALSNWHVDVVDARFSATNDHVTTSYRLPNPSYLHGGTNGWGFYVLGDTDPSISNRVDYYLPDGGNPAATPATTAKLPASGGFRLVRGMGAYVDRISYGGSSISQNEMVARGYTYTCYRSIIGSGSNRAIGLQSVDSGSNLVWWLPPLGLETPGGMNDMEAEVLGEIPPFPEPEEPAAQAALTLVITEFQIASGLAVVKADAHSTNGVFDLGGWSGVLQTNAMLGSGVSGWGDATAAQPFATEGEYAFGTAAAEGVRFFRIKAFSP